MEHLSDFSSCEQLSEITSVIYKARTSRLDVVKNMVDDYKPLPFGGCGGDIKELLEKYIAAHESFVSSNA